MTNRHVRQLFVRDYGLRTRPMRTLTVRWDESGPMLSAAGLRRTATLSHPFRFPWAADSLNHSVDGSAPCEAALARQGPPREEAEGQPQRRALLVAESCAEHLLIGCHEWS